MRRALVALPLLFAAAGVAACEPTGSPRCDALVAQWAQIEAHGYRWDCTPDFPNRGTRDGGETWFPIDGWTDYERRTVWVWPDGLSDPQLRYIAQHELGHVVHPEWSEYLVDGWAYCTDGPQPEVTYMWEPTEIQCEQLLAR